MMPGFDLLFNLVGSAGVFAVVALATLANVLAGHALKLVDIPKSATTRRGIFLFVQALITLGVIVAVIRALWPSENFHLMAILAVLAVVSLISLGIGLHRLMQVSLNKSKPEY